MASLLSLKRRIRAAQNVSKTTRAMQMISASKLKKAQKSALSLRVYAEKLINLSQSLTAKIDKEKFHPYMIENPMSQKTLAIILSPDKGLCGILIANVVKEFLRLVKSGSFFYITVGKKVESKIASLGGAILASFPFGNTTPTFDMVYPIARIIDEYFMGRKVDSVKILYNEYRSIFTQTPRVETLLPIKITLEGQDKTQNLTYLYEPDFNTLLSPLLKQYLEMSLYRYLLESFTSEQAARMLAMQNATDNAKDVILELQLEYNKSRQEKITNEILDITNKGSSKTESLI